MTYKLHELDSAKMSRSKEIAVIGAGTSGLPTIKSCLEEGMIPFCYEMTNNVGGLWNYTDDQCPGRATVYRSIVTNTSKIMACYSDFPQPTEFPTFLPHEYMVKYFELYAQKFQLYNHIHFEHKVIKVKQADDHEKTGRWTLLIRDLKRNVDLEKTFDGVIICSGHHAFANLPDFKGQDLFKGEIIHSQQYRRPEDFVDQKVVVIGYGNTSCEVAAEVANTAKKVYLSSRNRYWMLPRTVAKGEPIDVVLNSRYNFFMASLHTDSQNASQMENGICNLKFNHELYGMTPSRRFNRQYPLVNDNLPHQVFFGKVELANNIAYITEKGVAFEGDETTVHDVDTIICGTGFKQFYPYLTEVIDMESEKTNFYQVVFPVKLKKNTLAIVGFCDPDAGSGISVFEAQARWVARVFSGKSKLPCPEEMDKEIKKRLVKVKEVLGKDTRLLTAIVESLTYIDTLSSFIGTKPNPYWLLLTDPVLFWHYINGPLIPAQYRLQGPHKWTGARQQIVSYDESLWAKNTKNKKTSKRKVVEISLAIMGIATLAGIYRFQPTIMQSIGSQILNMKWL